jgi:hypothetical protein
MTELFANIREQTPLMQGLFLAVGGFTGVFIVIAVFFVSIIALEKMFRPKDKK